MGEHLKVLVTVKTYPHPSKSYLELVCTAGVLENGDFVRLYPIDYRYRPYWEWYEKYQWLSIEAEKNPNDVRPESYRPLHGAEIKTLDFIGTEKGTWRTRKEIVLRKGVKDMCWLEDQSQKQISLGIIKPKEIIDFAAELTERQWKREWLNQFNQQNLFGPERKPLEKIPYKFSYKFFCNRAGCQGHKKMIEDWEVGALFLKMRNKYQSEQVAIEKVKEKFLDELCSKEKDTHFFVGTVLGYGSWVVLGVFYPKLQTQLELGL